MYDGRSAGMTVRVKAFSDLFWYSKEKDTKRSPVRRGGTSGVPAGLAR